MGTHRENASFSQRIPTHLPVRKSGPDWETLGVFGSAEGSERGWKRQVVGNVLSQSAGGSRQELAWNG